LLEQELPEVSRREQIDEIAEKFCTNNGSVRNSRKRLSKALFLVPRNRLDLLPYYSRMAAILDRVWPDIAPPVVKDLEQQFHGQAKFKKNQNIESRFKTARYIGELTKFRVAPPIVALRCIKRCCDDFTGANIDVACCLLESCGRYLYRIRHTSARLNQLLEAITRLSRAAVSLPFTYLIAAKPVLPDYATHILLSLRGNETAFGRALAVTYQGSVLQCEATT
jgi:regulator of nonsense transcripts 2